METVVKLPIEGKIITQIENAKKGSDIIKFTCSDRTKYEMYHSSDCCEQVDIDDIIGDINDLLLIPLDQAEEITNIDLPMREHDSDDSFTWTFYKFRTIKGSVTIKWYGSSNGYYSESVDFIEIK